MSAEFQIFLGSNDQYYFRLRGGNNEIILHSQGYVYKSGCESGISAVRVNSQYDSRYERLMSSNYQHYFNLKAANYEIIGTSENYSTGAGMEVGISSVKRNGPIAPVKDLTE